MNLQNRFTRRTSASSLCFVILLATVALPCSIHIASAASTETPAVTPTDKTGGPTTSDFPYTVKFEQGATQFADGDKITIDEIRGTADTFAPGNIYLIKGAYTLASHDKAMLAAYTTAMDAENAKGSI